LITVYIPNNFILERKYAVDTLLRHYAHLEIEIIPRAGQLHYEITWADKSIIIRDQFFGHTIVGQTYLARERIPENIIRTTHPGFNDALLIFGYEDLDITADKIESGLDLFAGAFFMLTRWEESFMQFEDLHGRFPSDKALSVKSGFILRPIVDEYVALLKTWLRQLGYPLPPDLDEFKVVPTCDVDMPFFWLKKPRWKMLLTEWWKDKRMANIRQTLRKIKGVELENEQDPYDQFDYMMSLAEQARLSMDFNMLVGGITQFEGYYSIRHPRIKKLMKSFEDRKHRIGLHPSYNSFADSKLIVEEKKLLEKHLDHPVISSRQHYLKYAVPATARYLADAGIKEDSTLGYAAEPGFRCGTSKPFPVFDIAKKQALPLLEHPLLIMDVSFRFYKKYSPDESIALCEKIIEEVKKHRGQLVFLWHNSNLSEIENWTEWRNVFEFLMHA
jgi:hypothetical protein